MTAEQSHPGSALSPASATGHDPSLAPTASFALGELRLDLSAAAGAARLVVTRRHARDVFIVDAGALHAWARRVEQVLRLIPATSPREGAEYRTPFLVDREGRPAVAIEALVAERVVTYRALVAVAGEHAANLIDDDVLVELVDAAEVTARFAGAPAATE